MTTVITGTLFQVQPDVFNSRSLFSQCSQVGYISHSHYFSKNSISGSPLTGTFSSLVLISRVFSWLLLHSPGEYNNQVDFLAAWSLLLPLYLSLSFLFYNLPNYTAISILLTETIRLFRFPKCSYLPRPYSRCYILHQRYRIGLVSIGEIYVLLFLAWHFRIQSKTTNLWCTWVTAFR